MPYPPIGPPGQGIDPRKLNPRRFYTSLRNNLHGTFNPSEDMESPGLHRNAMRNYTNQLSNLVEPELAASITDIPGFANEIIAGMLTPSLPEPTDFYSKQGFDWDDISENRVGQNEAIVEQNQQPPPISRLMFEGLNPLLGGISMATRFTKGRK